jgi:hypothetical protein
LKEKLFQSFYANTHVLIAGRARHLVGIRKKFKGSCENQHFFGIAAKKCTGWVFIKKPGRRLRPGFDDQTEMA